MKVTIFVGYHNKEDEEMIMSPFIETELAKFSIAGTDVLQAFTQLVVEKPEGYTVEDIVFTVDVES